MKAAPVEPAEIEFGETPYSPRYGDFYHARIGPAAQARHVFLQGSGLPQRWAGRADFTVLEAGFGLGNNFLATWQAWRDDAARCERLHYVAIDAHPPRHADLARAHAASPWPALARTLVAAWPALTPDLHVIDLDGGRVRLLLAYGDITAWLPALRCTADAFYLDGFAPRLNPAMWQPRVVKALGRRAAAGATLATWSVARELRNALRTAGFDATTAPGIGGKREITLARHVPHRPPAPPLAATRAVVVGAGLAGAAAAAALAALGVAVRVIDARPHAAAGASGNPAALVHGVVHRDDGPYARLFRACALYARHAYAAAETPARLRGLLRLDRDLDAMRTTLEQQRLPRGFVEALDAAQATVSAGVPLARPAWRFAGGGWVDPGAWVRHALSEPGIEFTPDADAAALHDEGESNWRVADAAGRTLGRGDIVVVACAERAASLLGADWPCATSTGRVTFWPGATALREPLAGDGYAIPLPDGVLCGSGLASDDAANARAFEHLTGEGASATLQGRSGQRLHARDRLPLAGAVPVANAPPADRLAAVPRRRGLFVLTALGSRGATLAPLLGRLVAAMATGTPWPLGQDLADAIDPARWQVRAARNKTVQG